MYRPLSMVAGRWKATARWGIAMLGGGLIAGLFPGVAAQAAFDVVSLYQQRVKGFEAVYYLQEDSAWHRDRRTFEFFAETDMIFGEDTPEEELELLPDDEREELLFRRKLYVNVSGGLLVNVRPSNNRLIQLGLFHLYSGNQVGDERLRNWEMLHGGRITLGQWVELSAGTWWSQRDRFVTRAERGTRAETSPRLQVSPFAEINSPWLFLRNSFVFGLGKGRGTIQRYETLFAYDQLSFVDSVGGGVARYDYDREKWMFGVDIIRIGAPSFRCITVEGRFTTSGVGWVRAGFDWIWQSEEDFNLTRRGHFATSISVKALYTYVDTREAGIWGRPLSGKGLHGAYGEFGFQMPARWFGTALLVMMAAAGAAGNHMAAARGEISLEEAEQRNEALARLASDAVVAVSKEPRDEAFVRMAFVYSYNDPASFGAAVPEIENRHHFYITWALMY